MTPALLLLALVAFGLQFAVLGVMIRRKLRSQFPTFFNYVAFNALATVLLQVVGYRFPSQYGYVYWSATAICMLLCFWIFYEVFVTILKPYEALIDLGKLLFRWAVIFLFVGGLVTALSTAGSGYSKMCAVILVLEHCTQLMQCGMLMLLLTFESRLGLSWRSCAMGIGLGVGAFAAWDLTITYIAPHFPQQQHLFDILTGVVSVGSYGYWAAVLAVPQPARKNVLDSPARLVFQRWNEAVMASPLVSAKYQAASVSPVESFLPGVERTVEMVMARKMMH